MTSVKDVLNHATQTLTAAVEVVNDAIQNFEKQTEAVIQAVVEVAVAVSEALVAGTWDEFFAKLQEVFKALDRVRTLNLRLAASEEALPHLSKREKQRIAELKERIELALAETAAMKKLVIDEARRRQQSQVGGPSSTGFDDLPTRPPTRI